MERRVLYFINPVSGRRRKRTLPEIISEKTNEKGIPFEILLTNADGYYPGLIEKIKEEEVTDVVICGGDGTVSQVASLLLDTEVNMGIIPLGSGNGLALASKIPANIHKALEIIFTGTPAFVDAFFINEKFSCMLCGVGFDAQVAHDFAKHKRRGLVTYIEESLKNFIKAVPYQFDITIKGKTFSETAFFISIANGNQFGNNFTIAPMASLHDGLLDIVVVKKMSKAKLVWAILKQIKRGEVQSHEEIFHKNEILYFQADKLIIHNHQMAPLHIDGEPEETSKKLEIEILPMAFKLIMPAR